MSVWFCGNRFVANKFVGEFLVLRFLVGNGCVTVLQPRLELRKCHGVHCTYARRCFTITESSFISLDELILTAESYTNFVLVPLFSVFI